MKYLNMLHEYLADFFQRLREKLDLDRQQQSDLLACILLFLVLLYVLLVFFCSSTCHAQATTYRVTKTQLNTLDKNLATLEHYNNQLIEQERVLKEAQTKQASELSEANNTIAKLKTQVQSLNEQLTVLKISLEKAETSLSKYEKIKPKNNAIGIGYSKEAKSLAFNLDYHHLWYYHDNSTNAIGYKVRF